MFLYVSTSDCFRLLYQISYVLAGWRKQFSVMMIVLCDIKDIHMLALNSTIFFSCLRRVERPYICYE